MKYAHSGPVARNGHEQATIVIGLVLCRSDLSCHECDHCCATDGRVPGSDGCCLVGRAA